MTHPSPSPLGAHWDGSGTRFSLRSLHAEAIELCLFAGADDPVEARRVPLERRGGGVWEVHLPGVGPGQLYGYRAHGPWEPESGHRFHPSKLLVDPWARAVTGEPRWHPALLNSRRDDTAPWMPRSIVVDPAFDWGDDRPPEVPWEETVVYECHVKGLTRLHPEVPEELRGTYLGLASEPVIDHLKRLGVTTVELMPVHQIAAEEHLARHGRTNYWGYSSIGAFAAPHAGYATGGPKQPGGRQVAEFKAMVLALHRAGLEVLLDVVVNHTAEGGPGGPTYSLRGLDNAVYYRHAPWDPRQYYDFAGCGNTVDVESPPGLALVLDCLRLWVAEVHVDGFRFDLAPALGRETWGFTPHAPFFDALRRDPLLSRVKLIAEPWDAAPGGYHLGGFPAGWSEWNDRFRDTARAFWREDAGATAELATRLAGSRDLFAARSPRASVNFITCHDGFTLADLVSYERKHNQANLEANEDGHDHNLSRNWGEEGPTDRPEVLALRERARRNLLATLAFSWGVPMLSHGDEVGRTQRGNNNAYCHDSELTWVDWELDEPRRDLLAFTRRLFELRRRWGALYRGGFPTEDHLLWLDPDGREMDLGQWHDPEHRGLALLARGAVEGAAGEPPTDVLLLVNGSPEDRPFHLPADRPRRWRRVLATGAEEGDGRVSGDSVHLQAHSLWALEGTAR